MLIRHSIRRKLMLVVLATTLMALLVSAVALLAYDVRSFRIGGVNDVTAQADILALTTAPALAFNDPASANENLATLRVRPRIMAAAIYTPSGKLFASFKRSDIENIQIPSRPKAAGHDIQGDDITLFRPMRAADGEILGTIYIHARLDAAARAKDFLKIVGAVVLGSLGVAAFISTWLQSSITSPILSVTEVARQVMQSRDYSPRVRKTSPDEIGILVDAFNDMLREIGERTQALESSNKSLEHEMTERRSAEEALRAADRRKDEFLATLAHELRNPLAPLRNALHILRVAGEDKKLTADAREMMERQLKQMVRLVDDLLDVSRITTGKLVIRRERVELQEVVRSAIEIVDPYVRARQHTLTVSQPSTSIHLEADATRLAQVFSNLINNAAKYTDPGGTIALQVTLQEGDAVIAVRDNGIGIAPDVLPRIFQMFVQADNSLERAQAGLGVGLTLAKTLVELHGGSIGVFSEGLGKGSEFVVRLPVMRRVISHASPADVRDAFVGGVRRRLLIADDNIDFALSLAVLLRGLGHEVHVAHDGEAALELACSVRPQIAFLDIGLPKRNGYDLASELRKRPATEQILLVAVTGWGQADDRERARLAGFDHHLLKPVDPEALTGILERGYIASV